jgi:phage shock protein C
VNLSSVDGGAEDNGMNSIRLYRNQTGRMVGGVCAGLGSYSNIDPLIWRIVFVGLTLVNGLGILAYMLLWLLLPEAEAEYISQDEMVRRNTQEIGRRLQALARQASEAISGKNASPWHDRSRSQTLHIGLVILGLGLLILLKNSGILHWLRFDLLWPLLLVALGVAMLINTLRKRQ